MAESLHEGIGVRFLLPSPHKVLVVTEDEVIEPTRRTMVIVGPAEPHVVKGQLGGNFLGLRRNGELRLAEKEKATVGERDECADEVEHPVDALLDDAVLGDVSGHAVHG